MNTLKLPNRFATVSLAASVVHIDFNTLTGAACATKAYTEWWFAEGFVKDRTSNTDAEARQKIAGTVVLRDGGLQNDLQLLFEFMSVPDPKRPAPPLEPDERQRRLQALLSELLKARGREEAAVYLVEDLHWIDEASEDFVNRMVETIPGTQSLVVVNFRPEYEAPWGGKSYYRQLPLLPLGPDAMRELLEYLLGSSRSLGDLAARIQQPATGNPF